MFTDALRGYAFEVLKRDGFRCRYCGLDGTASFANWLSLSWDHLLPKGHPQRDNPEYIVAACSFCNWSDNHYFKLAESRGVTFDGLSPGELVKQRLPYVERTRSAYREFWEQNVAHADARGAKETVDARADEPHPRKFDPALIDRTARDAGGGFVIIGTANPNK